MTHKKKSKNFSYYFHKYWQILLIVILSLTPLIWYKSGYILAVGDNLPFWLNPVNLWDELSLWLEFNGGEPTTNPLRFPYAVIVFIFENIGISIGFIQVLFQVLYFLVGSLGIYFLANYLYPNRKYVGVTAAVFYIFNVFILLLKLNFVLSWGYSALPWFLLIYLKILDCIINAYKKKREGDVASFKKQRKTIIRYTLLFLLLSVITLSVIAMNVAYVAVIVLAIFIIYLYKVWEYKASFLPITLYSIIIAILTFAVNLWWIWVLFVNYLTFLQVPGYEAGTELNILNWTWVHSRTSLLNNFWFNTSWAWRDEYFTFYDQYSNPLLIILTFLPIIFALFGLVVKERLRLNYYLGFWVLVLLFFAKGVHDPLRDVNLWIYENIPFFTLFRDPRKFQLLIVLLVALMIGFTVDYAVSWLKKLKNKSQKILIQTTFVVVTFEIFMLSAFPLLSGDVIRGETESLPFSSYTKVPDYWYQTSDFLAKKNPEGRVLITPPNDSYQMPYTWGFAGADLIAKRLFENPVLQNPLQYIVNSGYADLMSLIDRRLQAGAHKGFDKLLQVLNVQYIVQRNDIDYTFRHRAIIPPVEMKDYLEEETAIGKIQTFGDIDIYEVKDEASKPSVIYIPQDIIYLNAPERSLDEVVRLLDPSHSSAVFASGQQISLEERISEDPTVVTAVTAEFLSQDHNDGVQEYKISVTHPGNYALSITRNKALIEEISIDGEVTELTEYFISGEEPITVYLDVGEHMLKLKPFPGLHTDSINIDNGSFEYGMWRDVGDCNRYDTRSLSEALIAARLSSDATDGESSLELQARHHAACMASYPVINYKAQIYSLSFDYNAIIGTRGTAPRFCVWLTDTDECEVYLSMDQDFKQNQGWQTYEMDFQLPPTSKHFQIYLYTFGNGKVTAINRYDNVTLISRLDFGDLTFHKQVEEVVPREVPDITFNKISSTKYKGNISNATEPFFLIFSQTFHPFWKLKVADAKVSEDEHYTVNSYANAWYIDKDGDLSFEIEYSAQKYFYWAFVISIWVMLLVVLKVVFDLRKPK